MSKAGISFTEFVPDNLHLGGGADALKMILLSGQTQARGAVLGQITLGAATAEADAGNTGDGAAGAVTLGSKAKLGDYLVECVAAANGAARFQVTDPDGDRLADLVEAVAYDTEHIKLTVADADTEFVAGDKFTVTVAEGSGKYVSSLAAAVDGSQHPKGILVNDTDASLADAEALMYTSGVFSAEALTIGAGHTVDSVREALTPRGMRILDTMA